MAITGEYDAPIHITGSMITVQSGARISSVINSTPSSLLVGASIIGLTPVSVSFPTNQNVSGSVVAFPSSTWPGSVVAQVSNFPTNQNVSGSVISQVSNFPTTQNVSGSVISQVSNFPTTQNVSGSVVAVQGIWSGSVLAQQLGARTTSVVSSNPSSLLTGNYGFVNNTLSSFLGGNNSWNQQVNDSAGRTIIKPFVADDTAAFRYAAAVNTTSVTLIRASAIGLRSYVTDFIVANKGIGSTLVTIQGGNGTAMSYALIRPGDTVYVTGFNVPPQTAAGVDLVYTQQQVQSILVMVNGYQAP